MDGTTPPPQVHQVAGRTRSGVSGKHQVVLYSAESRPPLGAARD